MTSYERLLNAIIGQPVDKTPWGPFLTYWWENQTEEIIRLGEVGFCKLVGADPLIRGHYPFMAKDDYQDLFVFDIHRENCQIIEKINGVHKIITYHTPIGDLTAVYKLSSNSNSFFLVEHPVKTPADFKILQYLYKSTYLTENKENYKQVVSKYGQDALVIPLVSPEKKTAFQSLIEHWVGTEEMAYAMLDYPDAIEETLPIMQDSSIQGAKLCAMSDAPVFLSWEDSSTTNYSPTQYQDYILPEIEDWCDILHQSGKYYMQHACGHLNALLPIIASSSIDCLESVSPPPTGNINIKHARSVLPERISIVGGIEPTILLNMNMEELERYVESILCDMRATSYVLANSDSCPVGVEIEKFKMISHLVDNIEKEY